MAKSIDLENVELYDVNYQMIEMSILKSLILKL